MVFQTEHLKTADIFSFSPETKVFPDDLKVGKVAPIYKSGDNDDFNNYRPISVLPTAARVSENILSGLVLKQNDLVLNLTPENRL